MTNNNRYWAGLSPSTSPWRGRKDIYSLGWFLTSRTHKSRIPPGFCPQSPNISYLWNLMFLSTSPSSFFHIHLCFTIATHTSLCSSPSLTSSLGSSEHSFQCSACHPLWFPICAFLILPHNHSVFSFSVLYSHLFFLLFSAFCLVLQPRKALRLCQGWASEGLVGTGVGARWEAAHVVRSCKLWFWAAVRIIVRVRSMFPSPEWWGHEPLYLFSLSQQ